MLCFRKQLFRWGQFVYRPPLAGRCSLSRFSPNRNRTGAERLRQSSEPWSFTGVAYILWKGAALTVQWRRTQRSKLTPLAGAACLADSPRNPPGSFSTCVFFTRILCPELSPVGMSPICRSISASCTPPPRPRCRTRSSPCSRQQCPRSIWRSCPRPL